MIVEFDIPDGKAAILRDAICENNNYEGYRKELQGLTDRCQARVDDPEDEYVQADMDVEIAAKVAKIGPALVRNDWALWRWMHWGRGQVQKYRRSQAEPAPIPIEDDIGVIQ